MDWKEYFVWFFKSFNPRSYKFLADRFMRDSVKYWFWMFVLSFIVMLVLLVPILFTLSGDLQEKANQIDDFYLDGHVSLSKPLVLVEDPLVVMDFNRTYPTNEKVLITKESLFFNKYYWFGGEQVVFKDVKNLRSPEAVALMAFLAVLIVPSLLMLAFFAYLVKSSLVVLLVASLGWGISHGLKYKVSFTKSLRVAIFAGTVLVFLELVLFPFWRSFWLPFVLFLIYYILGVVQVGEEKFESRPF
ncbi:MAG TPA: DUF1189 family protein [Candidatus Nanoarchaeia archaeon]|nr:DUF1189 family protein [Candidatus Nanoarchaeia archaeon]